MMITISDAFALERVLTKITENKINYPIKTAYAIHKTLCELNDATQFVFERFNTLFKNGIDKLNSSEKVIYEALMQSAIDINDIKFTIDDLLIDNGQISITVDEISFLDKILHSIQQV